MTRALLLDAAYASVAALELQPTAKRDAHRLAGVAAMLGGAALLDRVRRFEAAPAPEDVRALRDTLDAEAAEGTPEASAPALLAPANDDACAICLEPFESARTLRLSCGHRFHAPCLVQATSHGHVACPLCRGTIGALAEGTNQVVPPKLACVGFSADALWRRVHANVFAALGAPGASCIDASAATCAALVDVAVMGQGSQADIVLLDSGVGGPDSAALAAALRAARFANLVCVLTALSAEGSAALLNAVPDLDLVLPKGLAPEALAARLRLALAAKRLGLPVGGAEAVVAETGDAAAESNKPLPWTSMAASMDALPDELVDALLAHAALPAALHVARLGRRYARLWQTAPRRAAVLRLCEPPFALPRNALLDEHGEAMERGLLRGGMYLTNAPFTPRLHDADAKVLAHAAAAGALAELKVLVLAENAIGDSGVVALAAAATAGAFPCLTRLLLGNTLFRDAGLLALVAALDAGSLPALRVLDLGKPKQQGVWSEVHLFGNAALTETRRVCAARGIDVRVVVTASNLGFGLGGGSENGSGGGDGGGGD